MDGFLCRQDSLYGNSGGSAPVEEVKGAGNALLNDKVPREKLVYRITNHSGAVLFLTTEGAEGSVCMCFFLRPRSFKHGFTSS